MDQQLVVFQLAGENYGVSIDQVREINRFIRITTVPDVPQNVLGVINLRGQVIPVISLRACFGYPEGTPDGATRIMVAEVAQQSVGFLVDAVTEVLRLNTEDLAPVPQTMVNVDTSLFKGIGKLEDRLIIVLDLEKVFDIRSIYLGEAGTLNSPDAA